MKLIPIGIRLSQCLAAAPSDLSFDRTLWELSRGLSAAIYVTLVAIILFICYMIFRRHHRS